MFDFCDTHLARGVTVELRTPSVSDTDVIKRLTDIDDL